MPKTSSITDIQTLRKRARQHIDEGFVKDSTTRRMMEGILAVEEEHADDLADLLVAFPDKSEGNKRSTKSK